MSVQQGKPIHTFPRVAGRLLSGRPFDGSRRTNATFLRRATRDLTEHQRSAAWHWRPGWHRAGIRVTVLILTAGSVYGWLNYRVETESGWLTLIFCGLAFLAYRTRLAVASWSHRRNVIYPLWHVLTMMTGYSLGSPGQYQSVPGNMAGHHRYAGRDKPENFLCIPRDFADNTSALIRWEPPYTWEGNIGQQKAVTAVIERRLGGDWAAEWTMNASPRYLTMRHAPQPPGRVMFDDFRTHIDDAAENVLRLGYGTGGTYADIDLDSESPHVALSMGTGGGKSDTTAGIIAQLVRKGCERIDIIDPKRVSHNWAAGLPGVHIHKYVESQMRAIQDARILMDSRYDALDADETVSFKRHVVIIEEQNSLMQDLKEFWDDYRRELDPAERRNAARQNPAIRDLRYILNKGRQCRINVISIYQRMSADAAGGGDARENYGAKILARYSPQTWKILVGTPYVRPSRIPGRAVLVLGDDSHAIQRVYAGIADSSGKPDPAGIARLRAYALNGRPDSREASADARPVIERAEEIVEAEWLTLREACEAGVLPMRYGTARKARQRDPGFPPGKPGRAGQVYQPATLQAWHRVRLAKAA